MEAMARADTLGADLLYFTERSLNHLRKLPVRQPQQLWAFRMKEPYNHLVTESLQMWDGQFNYSVAYDLSSEGNTHMFRSTLVRLQTPTHIDFSKIIQTSKLKTALWFISHCPPDKSTVWSGRIAYALELSKHISIDVYTNNEICKEQLGSLVRSSEDGEPQMTDYLFYLSFESNLCKDYITEKFWKVLEKGNVTIPVALGGLSIEEYKHVAPPNSFIHVKNFTSPKELADHLISVSTSADAINYYHQWRNEFYLVNDKRQNIGGELAHYFSFSSQFESAYPYRSRIVIM